jgi:hypothetical protein
MHIAFTGQFFTHLPHIEQYSYVFSYSLLSDDKYNSVTILPNLPDIPFLVMSPLESPNVPSPHIKATCLSDQLIVNFSS